MGRRSMRIVYTALRSIATDAGHSVDTEYSIVIAGVAIDPKRKRIVEESIALGGEVETDLQRFEGLWNVQTDWITTANARLIFAEFLDSVAGGEPFSFDPYAVTDSAVNPISVILASTDLSPRRIGTLSFVDYALAFRTI